MNSLIAELKIEINKKEDDLKNIINEKDEIIKKLENKIEKMNKKLEKIDKKINQITINLLEEEVLIENKDKQIKSIVEENIYDINNKIIEQEQNIIKDINQKYNDLNKEMIQLKKRQINNLCNFEEKFLSKMNKMRTILYGIIKQNNEMQMSVNEIEKKGLYNEIKIYLALEEEIPEIKKEVLDHIKIKNYIEQYLRLTTNIQDKKNMIKLKSYKEIAEINKKSIYECNRKKMENQKLRDDDEYELEISKINNLLQINLMELDFEEEIQIKQKELALKKLEEISKEVKEVNISNKIKKLQKIEKDYVHEVLIIENKIKEENLIQKEDYFEKMKNYIQDENK